MPTRRRQQFVGPRIIKNLDFLRKITKCRSDKRRLSLLSSASSDQLLCLVEVATNILSSNFLLTKRQKARLFPHADYIRKLARVKSEVGARKVVQTGNGFVLPSLLIPIVAEAASYLLSRSNGGGVVEDN